MIVNRDLLMNAFLSIPSPFSAWCYRLAKRHINRDSRAADFARACEQISASGVEGDYLEFGVYRGGSFINAYDQMKRHDLNDMRLFAFDSFAGLPHGEAGVFAEGDYHCPEPLFRKIISKAGVDMNRVSTINGFYEETLCSAIKSKLGLSKAALVQIDCDLYSSTKFVLNFIEDLVAQGTILFFDDWHVFGDRSGEHGEGKAFGEWSLRDCFVEFPLHRPDGPSKGFIMVKDLYA